MTTVTETPSIPLREVRGPAAFGGEAKRFFQLLWLISKTESLVRSVTENMEALQVHLAIRAINEFIIEDLSHWYVRLVRRRFGRRRKAGTNWLHMQSSPTL